MTTETPVMLAALTLLKVTGTVAPVEGVVPVTSASEAPAAPDRVTL
jgi:hypothetical protein